VGSTEKREQDRIILILPVEYYRTDSAARRSWVSSAGLYG